MGLFDFARDAGQALRNMATGRAPGAQGQQAARPQGQAAPQQQQSYAGDGPVDANDLAELLRNTGVTIENGRITVNGDTATITGQASNQHEKEMAVLVIGNTRGIARVDDQITVTGDGVAQAASSFYVVEPGDSLSKIAKEKLGDASRYNEIFEANRPMLKDPDEIYPGQTPAHPVDDAALNTQA